MLAVTLNQHLIKRRKQEEYKTAHSSPPDYETKNIVSSSDGVSCAERDEEQKISGGQKIVRRPNVQILTLHPCLNHRLCTELIITASSFVSGRQKPLGNESSFAANYQYC